MRLELVIGIVVAVALVAYLAGRRFGRHSGDAGEPDYARRSAIASGTPAGASTAAIDDALRDELRALSQRGKKIDAIKRLRKATGMGLKEAKDYVDEL
jgi:hypothetical protein